VLQLGLDQGDTKPFWKYVRARCAGRAFQLPDPYPVMLTRTRTRPVPKIATRPDPRVYP